MDRSLRAVLLIGTTSSQGPRMLQKKNDRKPNPRKSVTKTAADMDQDKRTVYVSNLSYQRDRNGIKALFTHFGEVKYVKIIIDPETKTSKGMAFVEMGNPAQARKAIAGLMGQNVDGRKIKAASAIPMGKVPATTNVAISEKRAEKEADRKVAPVAKRKKKGNLHTLNDYLERKAKQRARST